VADDTLYALLGVLQKGCETVEMTTRQEPANAT
jgi:hypothetical protein